MTSWIVVGNRRGADVVVPILMDDLVIQILFGIH